MTEESTQAEAPETAQTGAPSEAAPSEAPSTATEAAPAIIDPDAPGDPRWLLGVVMGIPLIVYIVMSTFDITRGDGSELLTAILTLGGAHPSGYPLYTLLGQLPARFPLGTPNFNVTLMLGGVPAALTVGLMFSTLRRLQVTWPVALVAAWMYAFNYRTMFQAARVEVYSLLCLAVAVTFYAMVRHLREGDQHPRWLYVATLATCLGLTNHLTSVFLVPVVVLGGFLASWRGLLKPRVVATCLGIAAACSLIYLYLPWQAMANVGDRVSWNDPQTWDRFWFHVTGKEYAGFRSSAKLQEGLSKYFHDINRQTFPGVLLLTGLGAYELVMRRWKLLVLFAALAAPLLIYISTYTINDIGTYYPPLTFVALVLGGVGVDWMARHRFGPGEEILQKLAFVLALVGLGGAVFTGRGLYYEDRENGPMSTQVVDELPKERAIIFTSIDGHTFPMWYRAYVDQPKRDLVVIDTTMFGLSNKQWYRDWLRKRHPDFKWPTDKIATSGPSWKGWIVRHNAPKYRSFALLYRPWDVPGFILENKGWHTEIWPQSARPGVKPDKQRLVKHIYTSRHRNIMGRHYFPNSALEYASGEEKVTCVAEWVKEHPQQTANWDFYGPDGKVAHKIHNHKVPTDATISWEHLPADKQRPGEWRCEVTFPGAAPLVRKFTLK